MLRFLRRDLLPDDYPLRERLIYSYSDGQKTVRADPMALHERIAAQGTELWQEVEIARVPEYHAAPAAHASLMSRLRSVFGVKEVEDGGLNEIELMDLFNHFLTFKGFLCRRLRPVADSVKGDLGSFRLHLGRRATYAEYLGIVFNRERQQHRATAVVALGVGIGMGVIDPGPAYYAAQVDGENEAKVLQAQFKAAKGRGA